MTPGGLHQIPLSSMQQTRSTGVKTVLQLLFWNEVERRPGQYDWSIIDGYIAKAEAAGMKTLLMTYDGAIRWAPDDWYLKTADGATVCHDFPEGAYWLSWWNLNAMSYATSFIRRVCERYSSETACCIAGLQREGEHLLIPGRRSFFDAHALADFRLRAQERHAGDLSAFNAANAQSCSAWDDIHPGDISQPDTGLWLRTTLVRLMVEQQQLFAPYHREVWLNVHRTYAWDSGNFCLDEIYSAVRQQVDACRYGFQFTHFPHGEDDMKAALCGHAEHRIDMFAGSEWAEGLTPHTAIAIRQGLRGLVTAPMHHYTPHKRIEPWMLDAFAASVAAFRWAGAVRRTGSDQAS